MIDFNALTVPELRVIAFDKIANLTRTDVRAMRKAELVEALVKLEDASEPNKTTRPYLHIQRHPLWEQLEIRDKFFGKEVIFGKGKRMSFGKVISMIPRLESATARWLLVVLHPNGVTRSLHAPKDLVV
jgi:hypothetical protein